MEKILSEFKVLVVEDNPGDLLLVKEYIYEHIPQANIHSCDNFAQAEQLLTAQNITFGLVLMDLSLPDKKANEVVEALSMMYIEIPIIVLTGFSDIDFSLRTMSVGFSDYLIKDQLTPLILFKSIIYSLERHKILQSVSRSEQQYQELFQQNPLPMIVCNNDTLQILKVNKVAIEHYGYTEAEFIGMDILNLLPKNELETFENLNQQKIISRFENIDIHRKKNEELIYVLVQSSETRLIGNNSTIFIIQDVTEKTNIEKRINKAIIRTQEEERYELGAELHDNVCQILATSQFDLEILKMSIPQEKKEFLDHYNACVNLALTEIRNLSHQLTPAFVQDLHIEDAIKKLFSTFNLHEKFICQLWIDPEVDVFLQSNDLKLNIFRIIQEQLRNIIKYANASEIKVSVVKKMDLLILEICDDGVGFELNEIEQGIGFSNMKRRVEIFSGRFHLQSKRGEGCCIKAILPI